MLSLLGEPRVKEKHPSSSSSLFPFDSHDAHLVIKGLELGQVMGCLPNVFRFFEQTGKKGLFHHLNTNHENGLILPSK